MKITMNSDKKTARIIGILFIIGTIAGVISLAFTRPSLGSTEYLTKMAAQDSQVLLGVLCVIIMAIACASIGIMLYPVLRRYNVGLAMGVAGFRIIEGTFEFLGAFGILGLLSISREFVNNGMPAASSLPQLGTIVQSGLDWWNNVIMLLPWCVAALIYYSLFYRHRLVPRWLSLWGIVGILLALIDCIVVMLGAIEMNGTLQTLLNMPVAIQEMVLAVWLIVKGFTTKEQPLTETING
jgi:hypothetical protein